MKQEHELDPGNIYALATPQLITCVSSICRQKVGEKALMWCADSARASKGTRRRPAWPLDWTGFISWAIPRSHVQCTGRPGDG
jgi:hypothetical protein